MFNLSASEIVLRRPNNNVELKNHIWKLQDFNLADGDKLKVEKGKPLVEGTTSVDVYQVILIDNKEDEEDFFEKKMLFRQRIDPNITALELK